MFYHEEEAAPAGTAPIPRKATPEVLDVHQEGVENITSSLFGMTSIHLICVRTNSNQVSTLFYREEGFWQSQIKDICLKFQCKTAHHEVLIVHTTPCLSPRHPPYFLCPVDASSDLLPSSTNSLEQLQGAPLEGRAGMHNAFCANGALPSQPAALRHTDSEIGLSKSTICLITKSRAS